MKKSLVLLLLLASYTLFFLGCNKKIGNEPVTINLWINEREAESGLQWIKEMEGSFFKANENIKIKIIYKEENALLEDFHTTALAGVSPDLLWTTSDNAIPFITSGLIQPVDSFANTSQFIEPVKMNGQTWTIPISSGNHLMLMINKKYVKNFPTTTDEFIETAKSLTKEDMYGLVYNMNDANWLAPWLGGFSGKMLAEDGVIPTLNTTAMVNTLTFLKGLKFTHTVVPAEVDYATAGRLFKEGKAAMLINGDWSIGKYREALGDNLKIGRLPKVSATGKWPAPYISGVCFLIPVNLPKEKEEAVKAFIAYVTSEKQQLAQLDKTYRLPGLKAALSSPAITSDTLLIGSVAQMEAGIPLPAGLHAGAIWDAINPELSALMAGTETPEEAAKKMQEATINNIRNQK